MNASAVSGLTVFVAGAALLACSSVGGSDSGLAGPAQGVQPDGTVSPGQAGSGSITGAQSPGVGAPVVRPAGCETPTPGEAPLRRLSNAEYRNTLVDLLGDEALVERATRTFPRETTSLGFRNAAGALTVSALVADEYVSAAQVLAPAAASNAEWRTCAESATEDECARSFAGRLGALVYRRPLLGSELDAFANLYSTVMAETNDFDVALEWIAAAMLASPNFLFRVELSAPVGTDPARPAGYEMASRLSYLLWQSMPDAELFAAAASGELETQAGIDTQILRLAADPKALRVYEFFEQWLDLDEAEGMSRSEEAYPSFDSELVELLRAENRAFVYHLLATNGTFADLLSADYTFANRALAEHYGLAALPSGPTFERVDAADRAGVLTQGNLLVHDRPGRTSIVSRGVKLRTDFLCQIVPAPPDDVDTTLPALDGNLSQKERLAQHRENEGCAACHSLVDPLGSIFEGFDALGRPRTLDEGGAPVEPGGAVTATQSLDGDYTSPRELAVAMASSQEVRDCFTLQAFRFFYGRDATPADDCTRAQLMDGFSRNDFRLVDLIAGLARTDQFLYRRGGAQ